MDSLVSHIAWKTKAEAIYTQERQRMNRERFFAYYADFYTAFEHRDYRRISEVVQDTRMITSETLRLVRRMSDINVRRRALSSGAGFTVAPVSPFTAGGLRVLHADRDAGSREPHDRGGVCQATPHSAVTDVT